jgi:hypothetical protein
MPDLDKNIYFGGDAEVSGEGLGKVEVANFTSGVDAVLHGPGTLTGAARLWLVSV